MIDAMFAGFAAINSTVLLWMMVGVVLTTFIVIIPGLGGVVALVMLLPIAYTLPTESAVALLIASIAVSGTGNTITSIFFGVPGSASGVASILDGYPMAQKGEGMRAVTAAMTASAIGGILGAVWLAMLLPVMRPLVLAFGPAEFFILTASALIFLAYVSDGSPLKGLIGGGVGLMLSFVGLEISTGTPRFVFGQLYLWDGIKLIPAMVGLFALSEMVELLVKGGSIAPQSARLTSSLAQIRQGLKDPFVHWRATTQSSLVGMIVGIAPGLGAVAAQFLAYAQVAKSSPNGHKFGTGEVEGVIAADAATNSKDAGSLVPTLAFGIPGSSVMAIILVAMVSVGVQPGRAVLESNLSLVWLIIYMLVISNIVAGVICISLASPLSKVTLLRSGTLAPPIIMICLFGAYGASFRLGDIWTALGFMILGLLFKRFGYSRATLVIGIVLGNIVERYYLLSMRLYGLDMFLRPAVLILTALVVLTLLWRPVKIVSARIAATTGDLSQAAIGERDGEPVRDEMD
jgi:putative tricarboxylic transport membrane protein